MIHFKKIAVTELNGKKYITVYNPIRSDDYAWCDDYFFLIGQTVSIDGIFYEINNVERFAYRGRRMPNDNISLTVSEIPNRIPKK